MGGGKRETIFPQTRMMQTKKCCEKNRSEKLRNKRFLYAREYGNQKMRGKNARNNFSRNTPTERAKNEKKIVAKVRKNIF